MNIYISGYVYIYIRICIYIHSVCNYIYNIITVNRGGTTLKVHSKRTPAMQVKGRPPATGCRPKNLGVIPKMMNRSM